MEIIIEWVEYQFINELYNSTHDRYVVSLHKNWIYDRIPRTNWVWMLENKRHIPKWYVIHHIDKNRQNDVIENLQLVTRWEHNKLHADDINHYMFRKWHSYWKHPKSEEHKLNIKQSHINRANKIRDRLEKIIVSSILDNPNISYNELLLKMWRKSWKSIARVTWLYFHDTKEKVLNWQYPVSR